MRREQLNNFITEEERLEFVEWFESSLRNEENMFPGLSRGKFGYDVRKTSRQQKKVVFPDVANRVWDRIKNTISFTSKCLPQNLPCGKPFIAVTTFPGGDTYSHRDPTSIHGMSVLRMNIIIQKPDEGGVLHVMDESKVTHEWDTPEASLHCYNVTEFSHAVTEVKGSKPRFIFIFSMQVPYDDWEKGLINYETL